MSLPAAPTDPLTWRQLLADGARRLGDQMAGRWLAEAASGLDYVALFRDLDRPVPEAARSGFEALVRRRIAGEPLQHVLGRFDFAGVELITDRRALVPRPETELLVELALSELRRRSLGTRRPEAAPLALDLGTGSGAIACALVAAHPAVEVVAVDRSAEALALAADNRELLPPSAAARLSLRSGSWYQGLGDLSFRVDLVVSNPPYVAAAEWAGLDPVVRDHDPYDALVPGPTGLEAIAAVVAGAPSMLAADGTLLVEIAPHQRQAAIDLADAAGAAGAAVLPDLAGRPRVLSARW